MKIGDVLMDMGRPVAYFPNLARAVGGVKQSILLSQLIYWSDKGRYNHGWIYKTAEEIEDETGLTYKEQVLARASLKAKGILHEQYKRLEHRMFFRIDMDELDNVWCEWNDRVAREANSKSLQKVA